MTRASGRSAIHPCSRGRWTPGSISAGNSDERREMYFALLESDERARGRIRQRLLDEVLDRLRSQPCGLDPVERRRIASLLHVAEDGLAHIEVVADLRVRRAP